MRKILFIIICLGGIIVSAAYRSGAPTGTTCAPGETNCSTAGLCHGGVISTAPAVVDITVMGGVPACGYIPGKTYTLMPSIISNDGKTILGFESIAKLQNGSAAGSVSITNPIKTQKYTAAAYEYVTHTTTGSNDPFLHDWMYDWTAPPVGSGTVIIYTTFLAANGDGTSSGDLIYRDSLVMTECPTGVGELDEQSIFVYPNPAREELWVVGYELGVNREIAIFNMLGKKIMVAQPKTRLDVSSLPAGIYFLVIKQGDRKMVKQFCKI